MASISQEALRAINPTTMSTAELEAALKALSMPQLREWVNNQLEGYSLPELDLEIEDSAGPCKR